MDFLMIENGDGGELATTLNCDFVIDGTLRTTMYLSLFGGKSFYSQFDNLGDDFSSIEPEFSKPITLDNLKNTSSLISSKLHWLVEKGLLKDVSCRVGEVIFNITEYIITTTEPDEVVKAYSLIWDRQKSDLVRFGEINNGWV